MLLAPKKHKKNNYAERSSMPKLMCDANAAYENL